MYYTARVALHFDDAKGRPKKKTETYLVKAESVTDAEAIVNEKFKDYTQEFEVKSVSQSQIVDVYSVNQ